MQNYIGVLVFLVLFKTPCAHAAHKSSTEKWDSWVMSTQEYKEAKAQALFNAMMTNNQAQCEKMLDQYPQLANSLVTIASARNQIFLLIHYIRKKKESINLALVNLFIKKGYPLVGRDMPGEVSQDPLMAIFQYAPGRVREFLQDQNMTVRDLYVGYHIAHTPLFLAVDSIFSKIEAANTAKKIDEILATYGPAIEALLHFGALNNPADAQEVLKNLDQWNTKILQKFTVADQQALAAYNKVYQSLIEMIHQNSSDLRKKTVQHIAFQDQASELANIIHGFDAGFHVEAHQEIHNIKTFLRDMKRLYQEIEALASQKSLDALDIARKINNNEKQLQEIKKKLYNILENHNQSVAYIRDENNDTIVHLAIKYSNVKVLKDVLDILFMLVPLKMHAGSFFDNDTQAHWPRGAKDFTIQELVENLDNPNANAFKRLLAEYSITYGLQKADRNKADAMAAQNKRAAAMERINTLLNALRYIYGQAGESLDKLTNSMKENIKRYEQDLLSLLRAEHGITMLYDENKDTILHLAAKSLHEGVLRNVLDIVFQLPLAENAAQFFDRENAYEWPKNSQNLTFQKLIENSKKSALQEVLKEYTHKYDQAKNFEKVDAENVDAFAASRSSSAAGDVGFSAYMTPSENRDPIDAIAERIKAARHKKNSHNQQTAGSSRASVSSSNIPGSSASTKDKDVAEPAKSDRTFRWNDARKVNKQLRARDSSSSASSNNRSGSSASGNKK